MRPALLALTFTLLPLACVVQAADHASLGPHEHGTAQLNVALEGGTLALELDSPAMNLVGFEHAPASAAEHAAIAKARELLAAPVQLFNLPPAAQCSVAEQAVTSPLFGEAQPAQGHDADGEHHHSDIEGHFQMRCAHPEALEGLDLGRFFAAFPATHKVLVQAITPSGQAGFEATPDNSTLVF